LQELVNYHYIQITGGNRYKGGYTYKISSLTDDTATNQNIEKQLQKSLENIHKSHETEISRSVSQTPPTNTKKPITKEKTSRTTPKAKNR
jgi:hypothetical protein